VIVWRHLRRDPWALASAILVVLFVLAALLAPAITALNGQDPYRYHLSALDDSGAPRGAGGGISWQHWFGVEPLSGRDLFAIVLYGARTSILVGVGASLASVVVGVLVGLVAGYFGGWVDRVISRVIDVMLGFPSLVFMISLTAVVAASFPKPLLIVLIIAFFGWPAVARVIRGQVLSLRSRTFITAAEAMGAPAGHVLFRLLLPNVGATIIVYATILIPASIGTEAALSFLGVGVRPPTSSWGQMLSTATTWFRADPLYVIIPGGLLFLTLLAFVLVANGLRRVLDPRRTAVPA
jgi:peptide/nickel transport system permease protein